ncbi:MAG: hypothetical protein ACM685_16760, partial [Enterobacteriaceae bacterium]
MTNAITYPAAYNVLSCEEMTYTEGGVGVVEAAMAWFPLYGWYKAVSAIVQREPCHGGFHNTYAALGVGHFFAGQNIVCS